MDCPSEEQMIRAKLAGISSIQTPAFDIPKGKLEIYHAGGVTKDLLALKRFKPPF